MSEVLGKATIGPEDVSSKPLQDYKAQDSPAESYCRRCQMWVGDCAFCPRCDAVTSECESMDGCESWGGDFGWIPPPTPPGVRLDQVARELLATLITNEYITADNADIIVRSEAYEVITTTLAAVASLVGSPIASGGTGISTSDSANCSPNESNAKANNQTDLVNNTEDK